MRSAVDTTGPVGNFGDEVVDSYGAGSNSASAEIRFLADGTIQTRSTSTGAYTLTGNWYSPTTSGIGTAYYMRTIAQGDAPGSGTLNAWAQMNGVVGFRLTLSGTVGSKHTSLRHVISSSASPDGAVGAGSTDLTVEYGT